MAVKGPKSKPEVEFQDGGRLLSETGSSNISDVEFSSAGRFRPSQMSKVTKNETGSRFPMPWPPSWKIDMTS